MWNHNIHHHPVILNSVPVGTRRALDVGCGTGLLTRQLRQRVPDVVGVDRDAAAVEQARRLDPGGSITYLTADFFAPDWPPASFDLVASVAALHHMDAAAGLRRMRALLRPGGVLVVVGLAASELTDLPRDVFGALVHRWSAHALRRTATEDISPKIWPPPVTYRQMRRIAAAELPGRRFRRHPLWRYSITWRAPLDGSRPGDPRGGI